MRKVILGLVAITALVSCKKEDNGTDTTIQEGTFPKEVTYKDKDAYASFDFGVGAGLGVNLNQHFFVEARYTHSLTNALDPNNNSLKNADISDDNNFKNAVLSLGLGVKF